MSADFTIKENLRWCISAQFSVSVVVLLLVWLRFCTYQNLLGLNDDTPFIGMDSALIRILVLDITGWLHYQFSHRDTQDSCVKKPVFSWLPFNHSLAKVQSHCYNDFIRVNCCYCVLICTFIHRCGHRWNDIFVSFSVLSFSFPNTNYTKYYSTSPWVWGLGLANCILL